jgi:hypothetical protein
MLLYVKVKPNQRQDRVERVNGEWVIRLAAPAVDGKANEHLVRYLARVLDLPKSSVILKKGHTARVKCLELPLDAAAVEALLQGAV